MAVNAWAHDPEVSMVSGYDRDSEHDFVIATNSPKKLRVQFYQVSNAEDTLCEGEGGTYTWIDIESSKEQSTTIGFDYQSEPKKALYEWHICFEIDGTKYRAWRGFDPGDNTKLTINCFIDAAQLEAKNTDVYMCQAVSVQKPDISNYRQYAEYCWDEDTCLNFESKRAYDLFLKRGVENVAYGKLKPVRDVASAVVPFAYRSDAQMRAEMSATIRAVCKGGEGKLTEAQCIENWEASLNSPDKDQAEFLLPKEDVVDAFDETRGKNAKVIWFRHYRHFYFAPHKTIGRNAYFYEVYCDVDDKEKVGRCSLKEHQEFYDAESQKHFQITPTSNVDTAFWVYRTHRAAKGLYEQVENVHMLNALREGSVSKIEVGGDSAVVRYGRGACLHTFKFKIIGDDEGLEFSDADGVCY